MKRRRRSISVKKTLETSPRSEGNWAPCGGRLSPVSLLKPHLLCLVGCVLNTDAGIKKTAQTVRHTAIIGQSSGTALLPHLSVSPLTSSSFVQIGPGLMETDQFSAQPEVASVLLVWMWNEGFLNVPLPVQCSLLSLLLSLSLSEHIAARTEWIIHFVWRSNIYLIRSCLLCLIF